MFHHEVEQMALILTSLALLKDRLKFALETWLQSLDEPEAVERRVWELRQETRVKFRKLVRVIFEGDVDVSGYITA